jgi:eukaryotic-like serine/threonine-protein kinase
MKAGDQLQRYQLVSPLGQGGMGEVWLARLMGAGGFEKPCIVKTVLPNVATDPEFLRRFQDEAKVLVHLTHANIAQVYDMGESDGQLFMALEYVQGVDLSRLMQQAAATQEPIPLAVALYVGWQAGEGLAYAHRKLAPGGVPLEIVHRDISPHNVMVSYEGEVKVIDFGIARSAGRSQSTAAPAVMGKLGYMAPEQARAEPLDARADQYALAVTVWELLTGRRYVPQGTVPEMLAAMANPRPSPLQAARPEVSDALAAVLARALSPSPSARYPQTADFSAALAQQLVAAGGIPAHDAIGAYVKRVCSEAWEQQQRLLSGLSTLKTPGTLAEATAKTVASVDPLASTRDRVPARPAVLATPAPNAPSLKEPTAMTTGEVMSAAQPSRAPQALALAAVAALLLGGGAWLMSRGADVSPAKGNATLGADPPKAEAPVAAKEQLVPTEPVKPPEEPSKPLNSGPPLPPLPVQPTAAVDAGSAAPIAKATPSPAALSGKATVRQAPFWAVTLTNTSAVKWSGCTLFIQDQRRYALGSLGPRQSREVPLDRFTIDTSSPVLVNQVLVQCAQGKVTLPLQ